MKQPSCSAYLGIVAILVGVIFQCTLAKDSGEGKHAANSSQLLELRPYHVPADVFKTLVEIPKTSSSGTNTQPLESKTAISDQTIQKFLAEAGVPFPEGSFVTYNEKQNLLVARNTTENLNLMDRVLSCPCPSPNQVTVEARFLQMPRTIAEDLFDDDEGLSKACIIKEKVLKRITQLERHSKITVLCQPKIATVSGNTAQVKSVKEFRYPTEFVFAPKGSITNQLPFSPFSLYQPSGFETREIGYLFNVTPTIAPDGHTINLSLVPDVSMMPPKMRQHTVIGPNGKVTVEQPQFFSYQTTATAQLKSGQTMLLSVMDPVAEDGKLTQADVVFVLLSATVIRE